MTNKVLPKKEVMSSIPVPRDADDLGDTYAVNEETKEDVSTDLDDFERRLNGGGGQRVSAKPNAPAKAVPKSKVPPMVMAPPAYVHVKPTSMTEEEEDNMEALKAVSELERFEQRHCQGNGK